MFKNFYEYKYAKTRKGRNKGSFSNWYKNKLKYGDYGIKVLENGYITFSQLDAVRRLIVSKLSRQGQIWFYCIPNISKSAKPIGTRMGAGKGEVEHFIFKAKKGIILFEYSCKSKLLGLHLLKLINAKFPIKICGISRI